MIVHGCCSVARCVHTGLYDGLSTLSNGLSVFLLAATLVDRYFRFYRVPLMSSNNIVERERERDPIGLMRGNKNSY